MTFISILAPSRERLYLHSLSLLCIQFQSSLPHGSDSKMQMSACTCIMISILAPSRERRSTDKNLLVKSCISILAPSRERLCITHLYAIAIAFQSSLPHGSDLMGGIDVCVLTKISILAPSRERPSPDGWRTRNKKFQSSLPHGSDLVSIIPQHRKAGFQSSLPHGSDVTKM